MLTLLCKINNVDALRHVQNGSRAVTLFVNTNGTLPLGVKALIACVCVGDCVVEVFSDCVLGTCSCFHMVGPVGAPQCIHSLGQAHYGLLASPSC